jgi:hypothetical protein
MIPCVEVGLEGGGYATKAGGTDEGKWMNVGDENAITGRKRGGNRNCCHEVVALKSDGIV